MDHHRSSGELQPISRRKALLTRLHDLLSIVAAREEAARRTHDRSRRRTPTASGERHLAAFHHQLAGKLELVVYGEHSADWMRALAPSAAVWSGIDLIGHVVQVPACGADAGASLRPGFHAVFLPLMESHTRALPPHAASLTPAPELIDLFENKDLFGVYLEERSLAAYAPRHFWSLDEVEYPCVFKPVSLNGGNGVAVISDEGELRAAIAGHLADGGNHLLQSLVAGADEFVTHAVLRNGRVEWDTTFQYVLGGEAVIRTGAVTGDCEVRRVPTSRAMLDLLNHIGADLGLSGPVNVDYKIIDGKPVVFEINPRLGGSLMRPENDDLLGAALRHIVRSAAASDAFFAGIIRSSGMFDAGFYMGNGHEFGQRPGDPAAHYLRSGCAEGRDPSEAFSTCDYIALHFDRAMEGLNPLVHHELVGKVQQLAIRRGDRRAVKAACDKLAATGDLGRLGRSFLPASVARRVSIREAGLLKRVGKTIAGLLHRQARDESEEARREQQIVGTSHLYQLTRAEALRLMADRTLTPIMNSWHYSWDIDRFFERLYLYETGSHSYLFSPTPIPYVSAPCPLFSDDSRLTRIMARRGRFFPYWYLRYGSFSEFLDRRSEASGSASTNFPTRQTYPRYRRKTACHVRRLALMDNIDLFASAFTRWKPARFGFSGADCVKLYLSTNPGVPRDWFWVYALSDPADGSVRGVMLTIEDGHSAAMLNLANEKNQGLLIIVEAMKVMEELRYSSINMGVSGVYGHYKHSVMLDTLETDATGFLPLPWGADHAIDSIPLGHATPAR